jgi:hypothetical protein
MNTSSVKFLVVVGFLLFFSIDGQAQKVGRNRASKFQEKYLNKQFWVGIKGGGGLTKALPIERYTAYASTIDPSTDAYDKTYQNFAKSGGQAALDISFFYKGMGLSFQPGYRRMSYTYSNQYSWSDPDNAANSFDQRYETIQKLDYFEFPLLFKYQPLKTKIKPFVQVGMYYSHLNNAYKATTVTVNDKGSGSNEDYVTEDVQVGAKELYINTNLGWLAGIGASAPVGNVRVALDITYRRNTHNITDVANRYSNDRITGLGDISDDLKLRNISMSFSILMPLRFIILRENYKTE